MQRVSSKDLCSGKKARREGACSCAAARETLEAQGLPLLEASSTRSNQAADALPDLRRWSCLQCRAHSRRHAGVFALQTRAHRRCQWGLTHGTSSWTV